MRELQKAQVFNIEGDTAGDVLRQAAAILDVNDATFLSLGISYLSDTRFDSGPDVFRAGSPREVVIPGTLRCIGVLTLEDA